MHDSQDDYSWASPACNYKSGDLTRQGASQNHLLWVLIFRPDSITYSKGLNIIQLNRLPNKKLMWHKERQYNNFPEIKFRIKFQKHEKSSGGGVSD